MATNGHSGTVHHPFMHTLTPKTLLVAKDGGPNLNRLSEYMKIVGSSICKVPSGLVLGWTGPRSSMNQKAASPYLWL